MNLSTTAALATAIALHAAVLFAVPGPGEISRPAPREDFFEVTLYDPPPTEVDAPTDLASPPEDSPAPLPIPAEPGLALPAPPPAEERPVVPDPDPADAPQEAPAATSADPPVDAVPPTTPTAATKPRTAATAPPRARVQRPSAGPAQPTARNSSRSSTGSPKGNTGSASTGYQNVGTVSYVRRGRASYPPEALRKNQTGTVMLTLYINERGTVDKVEIAQSSGNALLDAAAIRAESKSKFRPPVINGKPARTKARVPYVFEIR